MNEEELKLLKDIKDTLESIRHLISSENKPYLTIAEAAEYLGIAPAAVRRLTASSKNKGPEIPFYLASERLRYIARADLDHWITKRKFLSEEEIRRKGSYTAAEL